MMKYILAFLCTAVMLLLVGVVYFHELQAIAYLAVLVLGLFICFVGVIDLLFY